MPTVIRSGRDTLSPSSLQPRRPEERPATTTVSAHYRVSCSDPVAPRSSASREDRIVEALVRLHAVDGRIRAFIDTAPKAASADLNGGGEGTGVLDGLPIAVKGRSGYAAPVTRRLVAAGAMPIGATSTPRGGGYQTWGFTERGPTRNPWRPDLSPGGSSAGSAAAVAAGVVELATGTDGAGSVRIPAAWCSVLGYKPTAALAPCSDPTGLATPGVLARDPRFLRAWADVVLDHHHDQSLPGASGGRAATVAWSDDLGMAGAELDDEVGRIALRAAERLVNAAGLAWRAPTVRLTNPQHAWMTLRDPGADPVRRRAAVLDQTLLQQQLAAVFSTVDLLMCLTTPRRPHGHEGPGEHLSVALTWAFNLTGHPAVSVPAGFTDDGAPVGLQIIARPYADRSLLALLERHVPTAAIAPIRDGRSPR